MVLNVIETKKQQIKPANLFHLRLQLFIRVLAVL